MRSSSKGAGVEPELLAPRGANSDEKVTAHSSIRVAACDKTVYKRLNEVTMMSHIPDVLGVRGDEMKR